MTDSRATYGGATYGAGIYDQPGPGLHEGTLRGGTATPLAQPEGPAIAGVAMPFAVDVVLPPTTGRTSRDIGLLGDELYQQILPLHGPDPDGLARDLVGAWVHGTQTVYEYVGDSDAGPGWSRLFDPEALTGEELRWLAQARGVPLREARGTESAEEWDAYARDAIRGQAGQLRGTVEAQVSAIQATLTGTKFVTYLERVGGDAYSIAVRTKTSETPDPQVTLAAMIDYEYGAKPAGLVLDYQTVSGQTYGAIAGFYASYGAMGAAVATYRSLAEARP